MTHLTPLVRRAALILPILLLALVPATARAGSYQVINCSPAGGGVFTPLSNAAGLGAWDACPGVDYRGTDTGLIAKALSNGTNSKVPYKAGAWQQVDAPPGARLDFMAFYASAGRADTCFSYGIFGWDGGGFGDAPVKWGYPADCASTSATGFTWWYGPYVAMLGGVTHAGVGVRCDGPAGCRTNSPNPAWSNVRDVTVGVQDDTLPGIQPLDGALYGGGWHRSVEQAWSRYTDNVGIRRIATFVDGQAYDIQDFTDAAWPDYARCDFTDIRPCKDIQRGGQTIDTTKLSDGNHTLEIWALDAAGNSNLLRSTIRVDNTAPAPPVDAAVDGGDGWRAANGFDVHWALPPGQVSPIARARWRLCRAGAAAGACTTGAADGAGIDRLRGLKVPGAGDWALSIWLEDAAGNSDAERAKVVRLRFDDVAPKSPGLDAPDPADPRALSFPVADDLSGMGAVSIELRRRPDGEWRGLPTGYDGSRALAHVPDEELADGGYDVRGVARDQAGNGAVITSDREGRAKTIALPLRQPTLITGKATSIPKRVRTCKTVAKKRRCTTKQPKALAASVGGAALAVAHGRTATVAARLEGAGGRGVTGVPVTVQQRVRGQADWRTLATVTSGADGAIAYTAPAGPSREVRFAYAGDGLMLPATGTVAVHVPAQGSITASRRSVRNGGSVRFRGRLSGAPIPAGGRPIALQAYFRGAWRTFATPRASSKGAWTAPYKFGATFRRVVYRFRAVIYAEPSYPYDRAVTPEVRVTVVP